MHFVRTAAQTDLRYMIRERQGARETFVLSPAVVAGLLDDEVNMPWAARPGQTGSRFFRPVPTRRRASS